MNIPPPTRQRVQISTGDVPNHKIQSLASAHPFTQQLNVVFPANEATQSALSTLETAYVKATVELSSVFAQARTFVQCDPPSTLTILSTDPHTDDSWCLDPRGLLTLHLSPESYQTLGPTGKKLPFKAHAEKHTVALPLVPNPESVSNQAKTPWDAALAAWDQRRAQAGEGPWSVLYCANDERATARFANDNKHGELVRRVRCDVRTAQNVRVPVVSLPARPNADIDAGGAVEDWEADMGSLFEWMGLAGLGAQRLHANDRVDPYVAVYDSPAPSVVGDVTHLRWRGFLSPVFVQSVIDAVVSSTSSPQFVSITSHAFPAAPVSYIPQTKDGKPAAKSPPRVPNPDGEDAWCMIVARQVDSTRWCFAESIGPLDTRWG
ncbi:ribonuclease P 40kDa subunit-domain-containing protein [Mycena maculata]|uniref:Ribonuclease P 40kDa subunit-domain-containing protein n=1 Tax=Mycena maculata TaxID=230809 RepID=A0AAD7KD05_9AGAR|nr:ribonuclease P 40kDa subunit-domain-containing protein [Mycena maculata]